MHLYLLGYFIVDFNAYLLQEVPDLANCCEKVF